MNNIVKIDGDRCKGCTLCVIHCPKNVLEMSATSNESGVKTATAPRQQDCTACLNCVRMCPDVCFEIIAGAASRAKR